MVELAEAKDRLKAIDDDLADMEKRLVAVKPVDDPRVRAAVAEALAQPTRPSGGCRHDAPARFQPNAALELSLVAEGGIRSARLYYRHVNQAERFQSIDMAATGNRYSAVIPASYAETQYPLQYYFELRSAPDRAWLYPGFAPDLTGQPYFVVRRG